MRHSVATPIIFCLETELKNHTNYYAWSFKNFGQLCHLVRGFKIYISVGPKFIAECTPQSLFLHKKKEMCLRVLMTVFPEFSWQGFAITLKFLSLANIVRISR